MRPQKLVRLGAPGLRLQGMNKDLSAVARSETRGGSLTLSRRLAAERQRLARHRRASKLVCVTVELRHSEIQALVCQRRLKPSECTDRAAESELREANHANLCLA
jgi:hypothetical protein